MVYPAAIDGGQARSRAEPELLVVAADAAQQAPRRAAVLGGPSGVFDVGAWRAAQGGGGTQVATAVGQDRGQQQQELFGKIPPGWVYRPPGAPDRCRSGCDADVLDVDLLVT